MVETVKNLRDVVFKGLQAAGIDSREIEASKKAIFPTLDKLFGQIPKNTTGGKKQIIAKAALTYFQNIFEAKSSQDEDSEFSQVYANTSKQQFEKSLKENGVDDVSSLDLESGKKEILKKPPLPRLGEEDAESLDSSEIQETTEAQAGRSAEQKQPELSDKIADTLEPVMVALKEAPDDKKADLMDQLLKTFGLFPNDKAGVVDLEKLENIKNQLGKIMKDFDANKLEAFLENLEPAERFELASYMKNVLAPMLAGGHGVIVAQNIDQKLYKPLSESLDSFSKTLPSRPENISEDEVRLVSEKRNLIAVSLAYLGREAKAKLAQNPDFDVDAYFNKMVPKLNEAIQEKFGASVVIYKDDIEAISTHLGNVKDVSQEKQKSDIGAFFDKYSKYALMAVPMILGPLANLISKVPIIGRPIASLAPMINNVSEKFGPVLIGMFVAGSSGDQNTNEANQAQEPAAEKQANAGQSIIDMAYSALGA